METDPQFLIRQLDEALGSGAHTEARGILNDMHPADVAEAFAKMKAVQRSVLVSLYDDEELASFIEYLPLADAVDVLDGLPDQLQASVFHELPDDHIVDLLQEMEPAQQRDSIELLSDEKKEKAEDLLKFPDDSAGGRMTTAFASVRVDMTVGDAIHALERVKEDTELLARIYVLDRNDRLLGKVRLRDLTFSEHDVRIRDIMDDEMLAVNAFADQEDAVQMMAKYDLMAVPVVNGSMQVLGVITHDDALDIQEEETTEDIEMQSGIVGSTADEAYLKASVADHLKRRLGWVMVLALLAIVSGFVLHSFSGELGKAIILAIYMPMVVAAGGNTGGQAATMVIRAMSLGEIGPQAWLQVIWKEMRIGLLIGLATGLCIALQITLFMGFIVHPFQIWKVALTVAVSLATQITASTVIGAALPMLAKMAKLDPAVVATPAITTMVDVTGLFIYFTCAKLVLGI
ncbi:MAG: magnesium transporter [Verrucomicrobiae bacterium]|nr:magnesium transporter [Verrucomicrobiae bacterium]